MFGAPMRVKLLRDAVRAPFGECSAMVSKFRVVFVTVGNEQEAQTIARKLVEEGLAACVGLVKQNSVYRWKGQVIEDSEILLIIKTTKDQFSSLQDHVLRLHSYEVPEIISIDIENGYGAYLDWIAESVGNPLKSTD